MKHAFGQGDRRKSFKEMIMVTDQTKPPWGRKCKHELERWEEGSPREEN